MLSMRVLSIIIQTISSGTFLMSEQAKTSAPQLKKEHSYTYWVNPTNKGRELPEEHRPKKVDPPPLIEAASNPGPSKWNALGSWEERSISMKELNENAEAELRTWIEQRQVQLVLKEVKLQGEFKQIFSNNKRKVLYEITGKVVFEGEELELKIEELTCSGDREFKARGKKAEEKAVLSSVAGDVVEVLVQVFNLYRV